MRYFSKPFKTTLRSGGRVTRLWWLGNRRVDQPTKPSPWLGRVDARTVPVDQATETWLGRVMDGWVDGFGGWMDGWLVDSQMDRWMEGWVDGWVAGWLDGWMDGWLDGLVSLLMYVCRDGRI